jgi:hypothetical protein
MKPSAWCQVYVRMQKARLRGITYTLLSALVIDQLHKTSNAKLETFVLVFFVAFALPLFLNFNFI